MGKSNRSKKVSNEILRRFVQEKLRWRRISFITACLFIGSFFIAGPNMERHAWLPITTLAMYAVSMITFRIKSQCPYCGKAIMGNFNKLTHCPYCKRPIKEHTGGSDPRNMLRNR